MPAPDRIGEALAGGGPSPWDDVDVAMFKACLRVGHPLQIIPDIGGDGVGNAADWLEDDFRELYWRDDA